MKKALLKLLLILSQLWIVSTLSAQEGTAGQFYPKALLQLDNYFAHHAIVVEKSTHTMYLYRNNGGMPELVKSYSIASGKKAGDKLFQGDFRTPEGVYIFNDFLTHEDLLARHGKQGEIYGVGAFVMDYPNPVDRFAGKTGGGIWLHSTNDETRIDKGLDSRGCVVAANSELIDISQYLELYRTPIVVVHHQHFLSAQSFQAERAKIQSVVETWVNDWSSENFEGYISHYHKDFKDDVRGSLEAYRQYKRAVFLAPGVPSIALSDISITQASDYAVVTFKQNYSSNTVKDLGKKTLFLKQDDYYNWKIVSENWTKNGIDEANIDDTIAFRPTLRFFKTKNASQIMEYRTARDLAGEAKSSGPAPAESESL